MIAPLLAKLPASRAADWGWKVTVCIAVICDYNKSIIRVTDHKVSFGREFSADEAALKEVPFHLNYSALVAGDDVEHAPPILDRAVEILNAKGRDKNKSPNVVADAVDIAYAECLHREIENKVLRKRGFTVDTFRETGKQKCTPSAYLGLCSRIDQVRFSLKFLVSGFDDIGPHIMVIDGESAPKCYDHIGMWAIGSGAHSALSSLAFYKEQMELSYVSSEEEALYFAAASKFMAENSGEVGKATLITIIRENECRWPGRAAIDSLRELWMSEGRPRQPSNLKDKVEKILRSPQADIQKLKGCI